MFKNGKDYEYCSSTTLPQQNLIVKVAVASVKETGPGPQTMTISIKLKLLVISSLVFIKLTGTRINCCE